MATSAIIAIGCGIVFLAACVSYPKMPEEEFKTEFIDTVRVSSGILTAVGIAGLLLGV